MTALTEDLQALLDAERDIDVPAPVQRQRMFARLEPLLLVPAALATATAASTAASAEAASAAASTTSSAATSAVIGGALKAKIVAAVVSATMFGGAIGAAGHAYLAPPPPASVVPGAAPKSAPEPTPPAQPTPAPLAPVPSAATPAPSAPRTEERPRAGSLRAERLLIEAASAALVRGDHESALRALRQHARQFPRGDLAEEREVLLVKALAASGDDAAAEKRAKDFKKKFPGSMQQGSVNDAARPR